ncbi:MAG: TonB-dependent receptor [Gemmatimonadetes bacterium]|nr:TonB-dependent receptor [Gemmatimonadota bacterium]
MSNRYCLGGAAAALALALGGLGAAGLSAQSGTVTGEITAATTGAPLHHALVRVTETLVTGVSNQRGRYVLQNVPVGVYTMTVNVAGFGRQEREITITPGVSLVESFALEVSATEMDQIVVVGGQTIDRKKLGVSLPTINVDEMKEIVPVGNFATVMEGRIPGVKSIGSTGGVGSGRELRIRGTDSFGFTAQRPVIYIDGVRYDSQKEDWGYMRGVACCYFSGGAGEDRLSDLNPEEIDRIEVLKGPAAATLFGAEASAGVIQVFTKRGQSDTPAQFTLNTTLGRNRLRANLPTTLRPQFGMYDEDSVLIGPAADPNESLIDNGLINGYDVTVSGGSDNITYFVSTGITYEEGSVKPNDLTRGSVRVNLNWTTSRTMSVGITSGFVRNRIWVVQAGDNPNGVYMNGLYSDPREATDEDPECCGVDGVGVVAAREIKTFSDTDRWTGRVQLTYTPSHSFIHQLTIGLDDVTDQKSRHLPFGNFYVGVGETGERNLGYRKSRKFTADYLSTLDYDQLFGIGFLTGSLSAGAQGYWDVANISMGTGKRYSAPGIESLNGAATVFSDEAYEEIRNVGFFIQNRFDFSNDLFVTAAVRADGNSTFGKDFGLQVYPKADVAYNFPTTSLPGGISNLKVRAALGMAGKAPGPFDNLQSYTAGTVMGDLPAVRVDNAGNELLGPENKVELETGLDVGLFSNRVGLELTYYDAEVVNGLYPSPIAASQGAYDRVENCCAFLNRGVETGLTASLVDMLEFSWSASVTYEWNMNRITSFGDKAQADSMPLYQEDDSTGYWSHVGWRYANSFGGWYELQPLDNVYGEDIRGYFLDEDNNPVHKVTHFPFLRGLAQPRHMGSVFNTFQLGSNLRASVQFRGELGAVFQNYTYQAGMRLCRCFDGVLQWDPHLLPESASPTDVVRAQFSFDSLVDYWYVPHIDRRDHVRLQDVSIVYTVPQVFASRLGLDRTTVTLSGYNLHWWDDCRCEDPNNKSFADDTGVASTISSFGVPQPRRFLLSVRTRF